MPSSRYEHISDVIAIFRSLAPETFLDVGCGFGRWGFLAREFSDIFYGRYEKDSWKTKIDAIEVFKEYICCHHEYIYDEITIGKIEDLILTIPEYDVVYAGDVLEHLQKDIAEKVIAALAGKSKKALITAIPLGLDWPQEEILGNPYEAHVSVWSENDLTGLGAKYVKKYHTDHNKEYAVAIWTNLQLDQLEDKNLFAKIAGWLNLAGN